MNYWKVVHPFNLCFYSHNEICWLIPVLIGRGRVHTGQVTSFNMQIQINIDCNRVGVYLPVYQLGMTLPGLVNDSFAI